MFATSLREITKNEKKYSQFVSFYSFSISFSPYIENAPLFDGASKAMKAFYYRLKAQF